MKVSIVLAHPRPGSFGHALSRAVTDAIGATGCQVRVHDLYAEGFPPLLTAAEELGLASGDALVEAHVAEIREVGGLVFVHPSWWGKPPAILAGWIDRVLRLNVAYKFPSGSDDGGAPIGLLKARAALVLNTSNTPPAREAEVFGDALDALWRRCVLPYCGVTRVERRVFTVVATSSAEERASWLSEAAQLARSLFSP